MVKIFQRRRRQMDLEEYIRDQKLRGFEGAKQRVDPTPVAPPVGYRKQPSMVEHIRELVRSERLRAEVEAAGHESFEEADDFEIADDPIDLATPYENDFDPSVAELLKAGSQSLAEKEKSVPPSDGPGKAAPAGGGTDAT